jgi:GNAT superfamily N-acetyltransferase
VSHAATEVEIARAGSEVIDELRPLWLALRDRHGAVMPDLGPVRDDDDSWRVRRGDYEQWLQAPDAFVLVARRAGRAVGYALVRADDEESATWPRGGRWALLESLSVLPEERGAGIGARLLERVRDECTREGFAELTVGAVAGNADAIRFYERHGFAHAVVLMVDSEYKGGQTRENGGDDRWPG